MFKSMTFQVVGEQRLNCAACEQRVQRVLKTVEGVDQVRAKAETQRIDVLFDAARVEPQTIVDRLRDAGYQATVA